MTKALLIDLVRWLCHQHEMDPLPHLSADFSYDNGVEVIDREDFLMMKASCGAHIDLRFIAVQWHGDAGAVMFESTDTVTYLRHRTCWLLESDKQQIVRLATCSGILPSAPMRPNTRTAAKA